MAEGVGECCSGWLVGRAEKLGRREVVTGVWKIPSVGDCKHPLVIMPGLLHTIAHGAIRQPVAPSPLGRPLLFAAATATSG